MESYKRFTRMSLAYMVLPMIIYAQDVSKSPAPVQVSVGDVTDHRTTGSSKSECTVELKFTGDAAADAGSVRRIRVTEAIDELGRNLVSKAEDSVSSRSSSSRNSSGVLKAEVKLRNPSRNATTIKILKGEVELFTPTEANGGLLTIKDILKHPAEPIEHPALKKYGIQLMYLTKETYEAKKKEVEAQKKASAEAAGEKLGEAFGDMFKGMFGGMMTESKNSIQMYVKDPEKHLVAMEFVDGEGKPLESRESWSSGDFKNTGLEAPAPADTQVILQLATPESVKSFLFNLENIPLP